MNHLRVWLASREISNTFGCLWFRGRPRIVASLLVFHSNHQSSQWSTLRGPSASMQHRVTDSKGAQRNEFDWTFRRTLFGIDVPHS